MRAAGVNGADLAQRVPVTDTIPLRDAASANERFATGRKLGKIVLVA